MKFYATTSPGLEEISARELNRFGCNILEVREGRGRVFFECDKGMIPTLNYLSRTIERVVLLLYRGKTESLEEIYSIVKKMDFTYWIKPHQSFAIRPLRVGKHNFTSLDIARVSGQALIESYLDSKGVRLKVNLTEPEIIVRVEVIFDEILVGLDLTGDEALHKRGYRVYQHPAPLNPSIAASLVLLSEWNKKESFLDPMCGSGTILIEAALIGRNIPPGKFRRTKYAFTQIFGENELEELQKRVKEKKNELKLFGVEKFKKHIVGAVKNAKEAEVDDTIHFLKGDATKLDKIFTQTFDKVITNPPYGLRIGKKKAILELYYNFLKSVKKVLHSKSKIVVITSEYEEFKSLAEKLYEIEKEICIKYGNLKARIFKLTI